MITKRPTICWTDETLKSTQFDDIYFNTIDGIKEASYIFLDGNKLPNRMIKQDLFTIAETGFGTGLNFLNTVYALQKLKEHNTRLHFISTEKYPLDIKDLEKIYLKWPQFKPITDQVLAQYPSKIKGFHHINLFNGKIRLTLLFGDSTIGYSSLSAQVDAWFLDGFSPSKNPDMWSPELFQQISRLSKLGTTFSTFTSASKIRRGLQSVGFDVSKKSGYGKKREISLGTFIDKGIPTFDTKPWFSLPKSKRPEEVTIIGGGLSGCSTAYSLAQRGIKVTLIEKEAKLASAGSGNRQGALYAKLPVTPTKQGELHLSGFLYTVNFLKLNDPDNSFWSQCGVAQLATKDSEAMKQRELIDNEYYPDTLVQSKTAKELTDICGSSVVHDGLFFPDAGWVSPVDFCQFLSDHPNITVIQRDINAIQHTNNRWQLTDSDSKHLHCSHLVICNAELANQFSVTEHLPLKAIRGQVSITPENTDLPKLKTVICGEGYISPAQNGKYCFGATFDLKGKERDVTASDHNKNLNKLSAALPDFHQSITEQNLSLSGRTAFRCSTPDYMPIVGPAPMYDKYVDTFARLRKDKNWRFDDAKANHYPNLYLNTGHGSKGLITCPIAADLIASMICNEPLPLPKNLIDAINPSRFIIKNLIKQAI